MIRLNIYRFRQKWAILILLVLLPCVLHAQSNDYADTTAEEFEPAEDTIYTSVQQANDTTVFRATPDSTIARLQQLKEFAYANDPEYWEKEKNPKRPGWGLIFLSAAFQYLLFGVFIIALLYILFKILADNKIILFKRKKTQVGVGGSEEVLEENDLSSLIGIAEQQGLFRLAARYRYMQLLENMNARQLIRMHSELTNWDYIRQMGTHPLTSKFRYLTLAYEYVWYGEFELGNEQYEQIRKKFETFFH